MEKHWRARLRAAGVTYIICAVLCSAALADGELIPVGEPVGIRIAVDGVLVAGVSEIETDTGRSSPAREAGIRTGDVITAVDGQAVTSAAALAELIAAHGQSETELEFTRDGKSRSIRVMPVKGENGEGRLGLWLRDGIGGIGTVTYIDPETGAFGALGHGVNDMETGTLLPIRDGSVCRAQIVDVRRGEPGVPGELSAGFGMGETVGVIRENTPSGIFGTMQGGLTGLRSAIPVADPGEVKAGPATILACVQGDTAKEYDVEIERTGLVLGDGRDLTVRVTDPELLTLTGGIVQGMSGSPILQNGKLVGAVTHVLVSTPERGYGILAEHMLAADAA